MARQPNLQCWITKKVVALVHTLVNSQEERYGPMAICTKWICRGLLFELIVMVHDGSYMPKVAPNICSAAVTLVCEQTGNTAECSVAESYPEADNYWVEALGSLIGLLLIRAATIRELPYKAAWAFCDNKGIVNNASSFWFPLKEKQIQSDVITYQTIYSWSISPSGVCACLWTSGWRSLMGPAY